MLRRIAMKNLFSSVKGQPWRLNMSKSLCSSPVFVERDETVEPISPWRQKDWFLYCICRCSLCGNKIVRLNLSEFCQKSSPKTVFEVVDDFSDGSGRERKRKNIPWRMEPIIMGSKAYFVGGERYRSRTLPSSDVYSFDPTDPKGFRLCREGPLSRVFTPRRIAKSFPSFFHLEDKLYLLATIPEDVQHLDGVERSDLHPEPAIFQVFDLLDQTFKLLPRPSLYNDKSLLDGDKTYKSFALRDKVYICSPEHTYDSYVFDTRQEKWESAKNEILSQGFMAVAEVCKGFIIAMPDLYFQDSGQRTELVIYQLDDNGFPNPKPYQVLHELGAAIFCNFLPADACYMGACGDDGRMWLVYYGSVFDADYCFMRVAVFRVSISNDLAGNPVFSANLETAEFYSLGGPRGRGYSYSQLVTFVMHHDNMNKHPILSKDLGGAFRMIPHAH